MDAFGRYLERCGLEFDVAVNVLFGGKVGETVSLRAAEGERKEEAEHKGRFWCIFCRALDYIVEKGHCAKQFDSEPSSAITYMRAALAFGALGVIAVSVTHEFVRLIEALI